MSEGPESTSLAAELMAKHAADADSIANGSPEPAIESAAAPLVDQTATEPAAADVAAGAGAGSRKGANGKIDIKSLDLFPTLGAGPAAAGGGVAAAPVDGVKGAWGQVVPSSTASGEGSRESTPSAAAKPGIARPATVTDVFTLRGDQQAPQARTLISEVLAKVRKATDTVIDSSTSRTTGNTNFVVKGLPESVERAKRMLLRDLSRKITKKIDIPAAVRSTVIGPRGSTLKSITEKTATSIDVGKRPKKDESADVAGDDDDDEETVDVTIEGEAGSVQLAIDEINALVASKVREVTVKIADIDAKFAPIIRASSVVNGEAAAALKVRVPGADDANRTMTIFGERTAALALKAQVEELIQTIRNTYVSDMRPVTKAKLPFVDPAAVFEQTGVVVVLPKDGDADIVELFGPAKKMVEARSVFDKHVAQLAVLRLDLAKAHDKTVAHARALVRFFAGTKKLAPIAKQRKVNIVLPELESVFAADATECALNIVGSDPEEIKAAKREVVAIVNHYSPAVVRVVADIDPFFFNQVQRLAKDIRRQHHVEVVVPSSAAERAITSEIVLVYEGKDDDDDDADFAPGPGEIKEVLDSVSKQFDALRAKQADITDQIVTVPYANHKFIVGPKGTTLNAILKGKSTDGGEPLVAVTFPGGDLVAIRGLKDEVDRVAREIAQVVEDAKNYEKLSSYTTEYAFPKEFTNKLVGKQGANLAKLREEFGVQIDVDDASNVTIKGFKKNADEAKSRIANLARKFEDEVTLKLKVAPEYHATLIGPGGKFVRRLREKYDVYIQFPKTSTSNDDDSEGDGAANGNGLARDQVLVRGPSRGVAKTKEEIEDLVKYEADHSYTETAMVPRKALSHVIGRQGERINGIKDATDTRIDVQHEPKDDDKESDKNAKVPVVVVGTKTGVKAAIASIQDIVKEVEDTVDETVDVDPKYHRLLIGQGGATRRDIITKAGGSPEAAASPRTLQIPPAGSSKSTIKVSGPRKVVAKILEQIKQIVDERENRRSETVPVPVESHGALIGPGGVTKREIEETFKVTLAIPQRGAKKADGTPDDAVTIEGPSQEAIDAAKAKIASLTGGIGGANAEIQVSAGVHAALVNSGAPRRLQNESDVKIVTRKAPKAAGDVATPAEAVGDASSQPEQPGVNYKWTVWRDDEVPAGSKLNHKAGTVTYRITGDESAVAKAKEALEALVAEYSKHDSHAFLWFADPQVYRRLIGPGGSRINQIRAQSNTIVQVPKAADLSTAMYLRGNADQLAKARSLIFAAISNSSS